MLPSTRTLYYLNRARNAWCKILRDRSMFGISYGMAEVRGQDGGDRIRQELLADKPSMICRFGSTELNSLIGYLGHKAGYQSSLYNHFRFVTGLIPSYGYDPEYIQNMYMLSGFFPPERELNIAFAKRMLEDMRQVDILGSWRREEKWFDMELKQALKVELPDLEPFLHPNPWSEVLAGKKVLVIHPFERTILDQWQIRDKLFADKRVLPPFELTTIRAVQTVAGNPTSFKNWFEALKYMEDRMNDLDWDIALIGCGAYGFPLAAHAKRMGRKAVHIGGATQLMFGIIGSRWENHPLRNSHWVRPGENERPEHAGVVEGACYW